MALVNLNSTIVFRSQLTQTRFYRSEWELPFVEHVFFNEKSIVRTIAMFIFWSIEQESRFDEHCWHRLLILNILHTCFVSKLFLIRRNSQSLMNILSDFLEASNWKWNFENPIDMMRIGQKDFGVKHLKKMRSIMLNTASLFISWKQHGHRHTPIDSSRSMICSLEIVMLNDYNKWVLMDIFPRSLIYYL